MSHELTTITLMALRGMSPGLSASFRIHEETPDNPRQLQELLEAGAAPGLYSIPPLTTLEQCWAKAESVIALCAQNNITILGGETPLPDRLQLIPDPPRLLFAAGDTAVLDEQPVAVIGTRTPSAYGRKTGYDFARVLAQEGWVIVSGLAKGCDTAAHQACIDEGGKTVAILPNGFGTVYPACNRQLAEEIVDSGGCLLSEYLPGTRPHRSSFIERDRLQSGLSHGVVVIEAGLTGGTMHTVEHALRQQRPVAALAHPREHSDHRETMGNRKLIRENLARPIAHEKDLLDFVLHARDHGDA